MSDNAFDNDRRQFLTGTASVLGGLGVCLAAVPFIAAFQPSERAKAIGAPVEVDFSKLEPGQRLIAKWRGKPIWILRRTPEMIAALKQPIPGQLRDPESKESDQPEYAKNELRSKNPEVLVLIGICTHLGCSPNFLPNPDSPGVGENWRGGFFCPCHGSKFDLAGRVFTGVPAPTNLVVPPYKFLNDTRVLIGVDDGGAA